MTKVLAILISLVIGTAGFTLVSAQSPYGGDNLPSGVLSLTIGGNRVDLVTSPTVGSCTPTVAGKVIDGFGSVSVTVSGGSAQSVTPAADGSFQFTVQTCLQAGNHDIFINGMKAGTFKVASVPAPPATGSGLFSAADSSWVFVGILVVSVFAIAGFQQLRTRRP